MPDFVTVFARRWKMMLLLTLLATGVALVAGLLRQNVYAGVVTALPANLVNGDKARIFNQNIEALYPELGSPDELDKIMGTAMLDTIYLAAAKNFHLAGYYGLETRQNSALQAAANKLKKQTDVKRTGYGELQIKVQDRNSVMAASLANALLQELNNIYQHLQTENNTIVLQRLKEDYTQKLRALNSKAAFLEKDTSLLLAGAAVTADRQILQTQLQQYGQLINQYELSLKTTPKALLVVETAKPPVFASQPSLATVLLLAFLASLLFSFLLAVFIEGRNPNV